MIHDFEVQMSPRSMKASVSGSINNIADNEEGFRKRNNTNSTTDMFK